MPAGPVPAVAGGATESTTPLATRATDAAAATTVHRGACPALRPARVLMSAPLANRVSSSTPRVTAASPLVDVLGNGAQVDKLGEEAAHGRACVPDVVEALPQLE